jgi:hypothetical protein
MRNQPFVMATSTSTSPTALTVERRAVPIRPLTDGSPLVVIGQATPERPPSRPGHCP